MSLHRLGGYVPRKSIFVLAVLALMTVSVLAWGQHEKEAKESKAPQHESKPSRPANNNANRGGGQKQEGAPNRAGNRPNQDRPNQSRPNHDRPNQNRPNQNRPNQDRPNQDRPNQTRPNQGGGNRPGNDAGRPGNNPGNRPGNNTGNRPGNNNGGDRNPNRPGGNAGTRPGNGGVNRPGNAGGNRPGNAGGNFAGNRGGAGRPLPGRTVSLRGGGSVNLRPNGQVRTINRNGMMIHNNLRGGRTIVTQRNNIRIVSRGAGFGYVQRPYVVRGGRSFYSRTYYDHGVYRVGLYRGYYWGGHPYYGFYPGYWYRPAFYGWAYRPWGAPLAWGIGIGGWGWGGAPWYGYYGRWFNPYPVYPSAAFWLTDYLISANLQAAYANQAADNPGGGYDSGAANYSSNSAPDSSANYSDGGGQASNSEPVTLTPEVKQAIAEEVKAQLEAEQQQSTNPPASDGSASAQGAPAAGDQPTSADNQLPPALDPARRTFVVSSDLTVASDGDECALSPGDVITRLTDTPDGDQNVTASVSASKKGECAAGKSIQVSVEDLQDMQNHFQEQLDAGMKALAEKQGTNGMPKAPDTATTASGVPVPPPDKDAEKDLSEQQTAADQTEQQVKQETADSGGGQ